ncbi:MAG: alpha/beta hydrolase [Clostridia bacterium]|nr:alpha/beta hydrolase [Clostridia bacterium]
MDRFTPDTYMRKLLSDPVWGPLGKYLVYIPNYDAPAGSEPVRQDDAPDKTLRECASGWAVEGVLKGLNYLAREIGRSRVKQYFVYDGCDCSDDPGKRDVSLIRLLPEDDMTARAKDRPFMIIAGGGAYKCVSTMVESLPTAVHMVEKGYTVFLLIYRVNTDRAALKALDDLAAAVGYALRHKAELGIYSGAYAVGGFSAAANLICNFGVPELGYKKYGLPCPAAMFTVYPYIDLKTQSQHNCIGDLLEPMFGENYAAYVDEYNIVDRIGNGFPPCYIVCGRDDMSVPPSNSERLKRMLDDAGIPAVLEEGGHAPHAFGDGTGTDVEGWPERAMGFLEKLTARA